MKIEQNKYDVNLLQAVLWQYENATNYTSLIINKNLWFSIYGTLFWQAWYTTVFDLRTANLFGLTIWSILLDLPLFVPTSSPNPDAPVWGFNQFDPLVLTGTVSVGSNLITGLSSNVGIINNAVSDGGVNIPANTTITGLISTDQATMSQNATGSTTESMTFTTLANENLNFTNGNLSGALVIPTLTEEEQRIALQLKYYQLVSRGAVTEVNQFLNYLFGSQGGAWMIDNFDMTITYEFGFSINPVLLNVIASYELLPKPAGVNVNYIVPP